MPRTREGLRETGAAMSQAVDQGKYAKAIGKFTTGSAGLIKNIADDVFGGAVRGAYGAARNPVEDFGRGVLGMEDRKEPVPGAAPQPVANVPGADATMPGQDPGRAVATPTAPKLVQGADGRQYLPEAVSADDRLRSDAMVKQAFSRNSKNVTGQNSEQGDLEFNRNGMNDGINTLRTDPNAMATANKAWATRGAGIQASYDSKGGLVLSNSTGPEKMQYTDREGNPTSRYENTAQYDNGQKQLAAATASLRNPDGSKWSEQDNAVMAANLRDGVSPTAGTSRAPTDVPMSKGKRNALVAQNAVNATLRGQDMKLQGDREQAAGTKANAVAAKADADRKYELDVTRLGVETANKNRDDKRAGEEAFAKRIGGMVGNDKDGAVAAGVVNAANLFLGDSIRSAEAELKTNPNNTKAARDLARLKKDGVNALDDKMISELVLGRQAASTAQDYDGFVPWAGKAKNSAAPIKTLSLKKGLVFDDYVSDDASGNQVIPARALRDRPDLNRLVVQ